MEAGEIVLEHLQQRIGEVDWLVQVRDGVEAFVQRCIEQFGSTAQPSNRSPIQSGEDYAFHARTAAEIRATMAAEEAAVSAAPSNLPRYQQAPDEVEIPESELAMPKELPPPSKGGKWNL